MDTNIDFSKTLPTKCEECENETFVQVFYLRKASKFMTGAAEDAIIPIPTFACSSCNHINENMVMNEMT